MRLPPSNPAPAGLATTSLVRSSAWALLAFVVSVSIWSCGGKREWVIPKSGEGACMCSAVCACQGINRDAESAKERARCLDACECDPCPGDAPAK